MTMGSEPYDEYRIGSINRNQKVSCSKLMTKEEFEQLEITFKCEYDPRTNGPMTHTWTKEDFNQY